MPALEMAHAGHREERVRIAAAGDVHCREATSDHVVKAFAALRGRADVVLVAGDLTTHGEPEQAEVLARACAEVDVPVLAVLGNHDWHADRVDDLHAVLESAGIWVLGAHGRAVEHAVVAVRGVEVGVAGVKGFVGGFPGSHLSDFGEPSLRALHEETAGEVSALDRGLKAIAHCALRIALLHYAPVVETLAGEPEGIFTLLGTDRLAAPIAEREPDLVVHGHAHAGSFAGAVGAVPVHNVSVPVLGRDFHVFELAVAEPARVPIH